MTRARAVTYCEGQCDNRAGCTGFFFQKHNNGHEICGFYSSVVSLTSGVRHGHMYGAVCIKPTAAPTNSPTNNPTNDPTSSPTNNPTNNPTNLQNTLAWCKIGGDPHVQTFDANLRKKQSWHPCSAVGLWWLVQSETNNVSVQ